MERNGLLSREWSGKKGKESTMFNFTVVWIVNDGNERIVWTRRKERNVT